AVEGARHALDAAVGRPVGGVLGGEVLAVVDASRDDRPVGIALEVIDDDLVADAWVEHRAVAATTREHLAHPNPAGARHVRGTLPEVPVEADADAAEIAVAAHVDLLAVLARLRGDHRRLRAEHARPRCDPGRAELGVEIVAAARTRAERLDASDIG